MPNFAQLAQPTFINRMILIFIFWNTYKNFALRWRDTSIRHKFYMINTDNIERGKKDMRKRYFIIVITVTALIILSLSTPLLKNFGSFKEHSSGTLIVHASSSGTVNKHPGDPFTVTVTFKNVGDERGTWSVNVDFEDGWVWKGTPKTITLDPGETITCTWNGNVPNDAPPGSTARLVVYYDDSYEPQDWWIYVLAGAQLDIISCSVS